MSILFTVVYMSIGSILVSVLAVATLIHIAYRHYKRKPKHIAKFQKKEQVYIPRRFSRVP